MLSVNETGPHIRACVFSQLFLLAKITEMKSTHNKVKQKLLALNYEVSKQNMSNCCSEVVSNPESTEVCVCFRDSRPVSVSTDQWTPPSFS